MHVLFLPDAPAPLCCRASLMTRPYLQFSPFNESLQAQPPICRREFRRDYHMLLKAQSICYKTHHLSGDRSNALSLPFGCAQNHSCMCSFSSGSTTCSLKHELAPWGIDSQVVFGGVFGHRWAHYPILSVVDVTVAPHAISSTAHVVVFRLIAICPLTVPAVDCGHEQLMRGLTRHVGHGK